MAIKILTTGSFPSVKILADAISSKLEIPENVEIEQVKNFLFINFIVILIPEYILT